MTKDSEKAEDFTHDIFLKVFDKLESFEQRSSFSTWLYAISHNYCSDQLRIGKRLSTTPIEGDIAESLDSYLQEDAHQLVKRAMEMLTPSEQALLRLKYEDGLSIEEIATMYTLKISAVKMRLKRGREKIQRLLRQL